MSPFMHADQVNEPILLIHGIVDNNSGTFPIQSRRYYHALKGHGAIARLVMLPHESHGYAARESVMHTLWEQHQWLERHVKNAPARMETTQEVSRRGSSAAAIRVQRPAELRSVGQRRDAVNSRWWNPA